MKAMNKRSSILVTVLVIAAAVTVIATQLTFAGSADRQEAISQAVARLTERGVPVESWSLEGSTLKVGLRSASIGKVGTPEDPINLSLIHREAFLAKPRGVSIASIKVEVTNARDKTLFVGETILDKELGPGWSQTEVLAEADVVKAVLVYITEKVDLSGLVLGPIALNTEDGAREIHLRAVAHDAESAGASTASLMINVYNAVNDTNALEGGQIALAFVDIVDSAGQPLLKWVYDAQRGSQDWWQSPDMTTDWFETPGPDAISTKAQQ